jgi:predicted transcriptional regulator
MAERNSSGRFESKLTDDDVLAYFDDTPRPFVTTSELAEQFGVDQSTAYRRLQGLAGSGRLNKEKVSANAVVWWEETSGVDWERDRDYLKSFGKYADTNIGEAVEQVHEELGEGFEEREHDGFGQ